MPILNLGISVEYPTSMPVVRTLCDRSEPTVSNIHKKFFDMGCGSGNICLEVLERRLATAKNDDFRKMQNQILIAISNIYAADISQDLVFTARLHLRERLAQFLESAPPLDYRFWPLAELFLANNIIASDLLSNPKQILFTSWRRDKNFVFSGTEFALADLLAGGENV